MESAPSRINGKTVQTITVWAQKEVNEALSFLKKKRRLASDGTNILHAMFQVQSNV